MESDPLSHELVDAAYARGRDAWPSVDLGRDRFAQQLVARAVRPPDALAHAEDLYIAVACCAASPGAADAFERTFLCNLASHCAAMRLSPDVLDEVAQLVRMRMLTGEQPKLALYAGRGSLEGWVRVVSVRTAYNYLESRHPDELRRDTDALETLVDGHGDPELSRIRAMYGSAFHAAVEVALGALDERDKAVLRMNMLDGLSIDVIAKVYRVHRASVARWLVAIRRRVLDVVQQRLAVELSATTGTVRSLVALLGDDVRVSVRRLLQTPDDPAHDG
jgi:RNA polymerase sigma-70 factor, ECF subfamily